MRFAIALIRYKRLERCGQLSVVEEGCVGVSPAFRLEGFEPRRREGIVDVELLASGVKGLVISGKKE